MVEPLRRIYKEIDGEQLEISFFLPEKTLKSPAIVFFHGGGWIGGTPEQFYPQSIHLAERGMAAFNVRYRFRDESDWHTVFWCVEDALDAFTWVHEHAAEFNIDPARIAAGGGSAGGHLAASLVHHCESLPLPEGFIPPAALALFNPAIDLLAINMDNLSSLQKAGITPISPAQNRIAPAPPTLYFQGEEDNITPAWDAAAFKDATQGDGDMLDMYIYEGQEHGFFNPGRQDDDEFYHKTLKTMDDFFVSLKWLDPRC